MKEIWKDVKGYEGLYQASNLGRIRSNRRYKGNGVLLKQYVNNRGYYSICICPTPRIKKIILVHRFIALAFIDNPLNKPFINHIDGNKLNNRIENLEWCTVKENNQHAHRIGLIKLENAIKGNKKYMKPIIQYKNGVEVARYRSIDYASKTLNINRSNINFVLQGKYKQTHGYTFKYVNKI